MFDNKYIVRKVADKDSRGCFICYRPTTSVMVNVNPESDFFYVCPGHTSDPGFAIVDSATQLALDAQEKRKKEIADLKAEWEAVKSKKNTDTKEEEEKVDILGSLDKVEEPKPVRKVYELNKGVYNLRINAKRRVAQEKKSAALLQTPGQFPTVPTHKPK